MCRQIENLVLAEREKTIEQTIRDNIKKMAIYLMEKDSALSIEEAMAIAESTLKRKTRRLSR